MPAERQQGSLGVMGFLSSLTGSVSTFWLGCEALTLQDGPTRGNWVTGTMDGSMRSLITAQEAIGISKLKT